MHCSITGLSLDPFFTCGLTIGLTRVPVEVNSNRITEKQTFFPSYQDLNHSTLALPVGYPLNFRNQGRDPSENLSLLGFLCTWVMAETNYRPF